MIWLILAPVMSASVEQLTNAQFIRQNGIDTLFLSVATVSSKCFHYCTDVVLILRVLGLDNWLSAS